MRRLAGRFFLSLELGPANRPPFPLFSFWRMSATIASPASATRQRGRAPTATTLSQLLALGQYERRAPLCEDGREVVHEVVLDCGEINTISSEDLNELIRFHTKLRHESATLVLDNVPEMIARVFTLTRLNRLFTVRESQVTDG